MKYIGVIGRINNDRITYNREILDVIYKYGYLPMCISLRFIENSEDEFELIKPLLNKCDGFILQGGTDFYDIDILIVKYLHKNNIPTLGICLGMQTMACAFGGKLNNIDNHYSSSAYVHYVDIDRKSKLFEIISEKTILVNSRHHQYVTDTNLYHSAFSNVIEAVEDSSRKFFIGVQWHPESTMDKNSISLFDNFFFSIK